ncbi:MAG: right-handed parallel beta-helix repeat-containing protein [Candidatus Latescibacterota bacterium]
MESATKPQNLEFYVAQDGNDSWSGKRSEATEDRSDGPFATLEHARNVIRSLGNSSEKRITVSVRGGTYPLTESFVLTEQDSGTATAPISYRAFEGETVRLIGGEVLSGFEHVRDTDVLERLGKEAHEHVLQCNLSAHGIRDFGRFVSRGFGRPATPAHLELFFQDRRMEVARWPNNDFARIAAPAEPMPEGDGHGGPLGRIESGFLYGGDRPRRWKSLNNVWMHGYWAWDWANSYEQVASIDENTGLIQTKPPYGPYGIKADQRFYFLNILEELDQPGEYYVDREEGILYFWPPAALEEGETAVSLLEEPLIQIQDAHDITLQGFVMEYARGNGAQIHEGTNVHLADCTVRNIGNYAVLVNGGFSHRVTGCTVYNTGDGGIQLHGGDRNTLSPAGHVAENNHIHHIGQWSRCYQPAIKVQGVGIRVAHNLLHDGPHSAIQLGGNEHLIEFNHIHHVCQETGDVGAFYMGRDWTMRGNIIRHNFFHDTHGYGMGSMAVYLDDCASGTTVFGNVFYRCTRAAFVGGGRDNWVENNIFIQCDPAVMIDGRGLDPKPIWHNMVYETMKESLDAMMPNQPPYSNQYPKLAQLERYYQGDTGVPPEGNRVVRNISFGGTWLDIHWLADPDIVAVSDNLVDIDPHFVDAAGLNFQLRDDSPAYALGFERIPMEQIGLVAEACPLKSEETGQAT